MTSGNGEDYSKVIRIPVPDKMETAEEILEFGKKYCRTLLAIYGEETKILINKDKLEKSLIDLPDNCPKCNERLVNIAIESNIKDYEECLCKYINKIDKISQDIKNDGKKILLNKNNLEEILKNIPQKCPICKSDFSKENFYLVDISSGSSTETYIECTCENYREVIVEMR